MEETKVYLHKIAPVVPEKYYTQKFALRKMKELTAKSTKDRIFLNKVYKGTQIEKRHAIIEDYDKNPEDYTFYPKNKSLKPEPTTEQRNDLYAEKAIELSIKAVRHLFDNSPEFDKNQITHIITVSCTGCMAPGFDFYIVRDLGLPISIHRYHLGFMGCQGAFPAMKLARNICLSEPDARVLVVNVEICSVHLQQIRKLDVAIANAIFADGVSAALISSQSDDMKGPKYLLHDFLSSIADDTEDDMAWK
ncbi:MAG: UbiA family prenyltransferase, partial [Candidatus Heimdallarchaeaceae archaeon]